MRITAIIVALNEAPFIATAVKAIYPFVQRILVQTGYDRSWNNQPVEPDGTVQKLLEFPDANGKISILIRRLPDEAIARNSLMRMDRYDLNHRHRNTVGMEADVARLCDETDYFWIVDGDEIYDPRTIDPILSFLSAHRPRVLTIRGLTYFRSWNYVVDPSDNFFQPGFVRPRLVFRENRLLDVSRHQRLLANKYTRSFYPDIDRRTQALLGIHRLPEEIGVFHHASYVGDDARILKKTRLSVHYGEKMAAWYRDVWLKWTPLSTNLHPLRPDVFPALRHVPTSELPPIVRDEAWPTSYIER